MKSSKTNLIVRSSFVTLLGKTDTNAFPLNGQEKRF